jgi:hypothetical protein
MTRTRLFCGIAGLVAGAALAIACVVGTRSPITHTNFLQPSRALSVPTSAPEECLHWQTQSAKTPVSAEQVYFCNGDRGLRAYRPGTNVLSRQVVFFKDTERKRLYAEYAPDGKQVINGFELRDDGTTLWQASLAGKFVTKITYWWNGKVFSTEQRGVGADIVEATYFAADGNRIAHVVVGTDLPLQVAVQRTITRIDEDNKIADFYLGDYHKKMPVAMANKPFLREAEFWSRDGRLLMDLQPQSNGDRVYRFFRDDGTLWYEQFWKSVKDGDDSGTWRTIRIAEVKVYDTDGARLVSKLSRPNANVMIQKLEEYRRNGNRIAYDLTGIGNVKAVDTFNATGDKLSSVVVKNPGENAQPAPFDFNLTKEPVVAEPAEAWRTEEDAHYKRTLVQ